MPSLFTTAVHDLRVLLLRIAHNESLSADTRGGGRESNLKFVVPLVQLGVYFGRTVGFGAAVAEQAAGAARPPTPQNGRAL